MRGRYRLLGALLSAALLLCGFAGCSRFSNTDIKFTVGLNDNELFRIGKETCTIEEAMIFVTSQKSIYEGSYSDQIWDITLNDGTFETFVKASLQNFLAREKCMVAMAKDHEMTTNGEEEQRIKEAADEYFKALGPEAAAATGITKELVETVFREYYLSNKLLEDLTKDVDVEISDNDARIIHIQQIFIKAGGDGEADKAEQKSLAEDLVSRLEGGSDFVSLADRYSDAEDIEVTCGRGQYPGVVEDVMFGLEDGEISGVIETTGGYYIIKCLEDYDEAATELHKKQMGAELKEEAFSQLYDTFTSNLVAEYNEKAWENLTYKGEGVNPKANFYEIYAEYFGK